MLSPRRSPNLVSIQLITNNMQDIIDKIEKMSVLELNELVKAIEVKFGASAQAAVAPASVVGSGEVKEEKDNFDVQLVSFGANKIAVIKVVKEALALMLKEGMKKTEAEALKKKIEDQGGKVELK